MTVDTSRIHPAGSLSLSACRRQHRTSRAEGNPTTPPAARGSARVAGANSLGQGIFSFSRQLLEGLSGPDRDLADCPASFPGKGAGKSEDPNSEFITPNRELTHRIAAPFRVSSRRNMPRAQYA